jgi:hypothetical protein
MISVSFCHAGPPPQSTTAWVHLLYARGTCPPPLRRRGCAVLVGMAARGRGRHDLKGTPSYTRLGPRQWRVAAAYTRGKSTMASLDLGLVGLDVGSRIFLLLKIDV